MGNIVGNLEIVDLPIPQMGNRPRKLRIWTPKDDDICPTRRTYPVLYMHDGQNLFDASTISHGHGEWQVDETVNRLANEIENFNGLVVVGIDNSEDRMSEYLPDDATWRGEDFEGIGHLYARYLVETVKPFIDQRCNTKTDPQNTLLAGSSLGGLISFYTGLLYPNVFGKIGAMSPSFQLFEEDQRLALYQEAGLDNPNSEALKLKIWLDSGQKESHNTQTDLVRQELLARGFKHDRVHSLVMENHGHNEEAWRERFPLMISWLLRLDS